MCRLWTRQCQKLTVELQIYISQPWCYRKNNFKPNDFKAGADECGIRHWQHKSSIMQVGKRYVNFEHGNKYTVYPFTGTPRCRLVGNRFAGTSCISTPAPRFLITPHQAGCISWLSAQIERESLTSFKLLFEDLSSEFCLSFGEVFNFQNKLKVIYHERFRQIFFFAWLLQKGQQLCFIPNGLKAYCD